VIFSGGGGGGGGLVVSNDEVRTELTHDENWTVI
jgi:hypothetical protein